MQFNNRMVRSAATSFVALFLVGGAAFATTSFIGGVRLDDSRPAAELASASIDPTASVDPTVTPKTIDFKTTKGNNAGQTAFGIYEMSGKTRKLCIAEQGRPRPADFSATAGSGRMLVVFERVDPTK